MTNNLHLTFFYYPNFFHSQFFRFISRIANAWMHCVKSITCTFQFMCNGKCNIQLFFWVLNYPVCLKTSGNTWLDRAEVILAVCFENNGSEEALKIDWKNDRNWEYRLMLSNKNIEKKQVIQKSAISGTKYFSLLKFYTVIKKHILVCEFIQIHGVQMNLLAIIQMPTSTSIWFSYGLSHMVSTCLRREEGCEI